MKALKYLRHLNLQLPFLLTSLFFFAGSANANDLVFPQYNFNVSTTDKSALKLNTHTTLLVTLVPTSKDAPVVSGFLFDARMPQHKHGMVTKPKVVKVSDLQYRVEGVRLHMAGLWVFEFSAQHPTGETKVTSSFDLSTK